jgi:glycosyltransferase involved in cell wall biosynthesis
MKILLSAYSCDPVQGSEPGVGWNAVLQAARFHDVWVLTHSEGREGITNALAGQQLSNVKVFFVDLPSWALFWKKGRRGQRLHYYLWQLAAYFVGRRLHREIAFDLIHHVTFVQYSVPSFLALLPVPFIWGPVGGAESAPRAYWSSFSTRGKAWELARAFACKIGELDPFVRMTALRAKVGLATTPETEARVRALGCRQVYVQPAVGLDQNEILRLSQVPSRQEGPFRVLSVARLVHWKGCHLGLKAFAQFHRQFPESEYWIVGEGPERGRLHRLAKALGVTDSVRFKGNLPRDEVLRILEDCDVLLHPSLHDSGGCVSLEAMAAGRPVICLDLGGPALQVTEKTGFKVAPDAIDDTVVHLANAILKLAVDGGLRVQMGKASRERVQEHFAWHRKGDFMNKIYEDIFRRPDFRLIGAASVPEPRIEH